MTWLGRTLLAGLALWFGGLLYFIHLIPREALHGGKQTDGIVVLTGGGGRLEGALALLAAGKGKRLLISGVYEKTTRRALRARLKAAGEVFDCCVDLGRAAHDTVGNAREAAAWAHAHGYGSLRIVTANYHMPRALIEFRRVLPRAELVAHPVTAPSVHLENWWRWPGTTRVLIGEYNKYLFSLIRARI
jgi:uncharacterized SAM-binding protein YcdF (DUF218 family)